MLLRKSLNILGISSPETFFHCGLTLSLSLGMHNIRSYLLWTLAACILWEGSLAEDLSSLCTCPQGIETKLENQIQALQTKLEESLARLDRSLFAIQMRLEAQIEAVVQKIENKNQPQAVPNKTSKVKVQDSDGNTIPPGFERIGSRYFRIVEEPETWATARRKCREMGGHLASFRNEEELTAVRAKLQVGSYYWLGINDRDKEGHFVSVASHKPAQFLKWFEGEPNDKNQVQNCVFLYYGEMWDDNCSAQSKFICQADSET